MHRPWDQREGGGGGGGLQQGEGGRGNKASPLDALFNMISNNDALTAKSGKLVYGTKSLGSSTGAQHTHKNYLGVQK